MDDPDHQRANELVCAKAAEPPIQPFDHWRFMVLMLIGTAMEMDNAAMAVRVRGNQTRASASDGPHLLDDPSEVPRAQHDQHQGDAHFQCQPEPGRNNESKEDERSADDD